MDILKHEKAIFEKNGLVIHDSITVDEWKNLGLSLKQVEGCVQFWIGDWARYGEKRGFTGKYTDSKVYDELEEITGLQRDTIQKFKSVSDRVESGIRIPDLTFNHHREVAALPPEKQQEYLNEASEKKLSVRDLRELIKKPHVSHNSGENEWYTPKYIIDAARFVMGSIDLDPASCEIANKTVKASKFYSLSDNGLLKNWFGNVWLNPPYSQPSISQFSNKVTQLEFKQACILVNNATETIWFQNMFELSNSVCFLKGRVKFIDKDGNETGAPLQGQCVLYFGNNQIEFAETFQNYGICTTILK